MTEDEFPDIDMDPLTKSRLDFEAYLADVAKLVDGHTQSFEALGYSRQEALYFSGQFHAMLIAKITKGSNQ